MKVYPTSYKTVTKMTQFENQELEMWLNFKPFNKELALQGNLNDSDNAKIFSNKNNNYSIGKFMYDKRGNLFDNSVSFPKNTREIRIIKWSLSWNFMKKANVDKSVIIEMCTWSDNGTEYGIYYLVDIVIGFNYDYSFESASDKYKYLTETFFNIRERLFWNQMNFKDESLKLSQKRIDDVKRFNLIMSVDLFQRVKDILNIFNDMKYIGASEEDKNLVISWSYKNTLIYEITKNNFGIVFIEGNNVYIVDKTHVINYTVYCKFIRSEFEAFRNAITLGIDEAQEKYRGLNPMILALELNRTRFIQEREKYLRNIKKKKD